MSTPSDREIVFRVAAARGRTDAKAVALMLPLRRRSARLYMRWAFAHGTRLMRPGQPWVPPGAWCQGHASGLLCGLPDEWRWSGCPCPETEAELVHHARSRLMLDHIVWWATQGSTRRAESEVAADEQLYPDHGALAQDGEFELRDQISRLDLADDLVAEYARSTSSAPGVETRLVSLGIHTDTPMTAEGQTR